MALPAVARRVLPAGPGAPPRAGVPVLAAEQRRDQRDVLLAAAAGVVPPLGRRRRPPDFTLRGEGPPVRHPHEEAARRRRRRWPTSSPPACSRWASKIGPLLWQLPPNLGFDADRLADFFALLPRSTDEAAALARRHDERMDGRAFTDEIVRLPLRHALEVRHHSFVTPAFTDAAARARHRAGRSPTPPGAGRCPTRSPATWSTSGCTATSSSTPAATPTPRSTPGRRGSGRGAAAGHDVQVHFDNDVKVHAPFDAIALAELGSSSERSVLGRRRRSHFSLDEVHDRGVGQRRDVAELACGRRRRAAAGA